MKSPLKKIYILLIAVTVLVLGVGTGYVFVDIKRSERSDLLATSHKKETEAYQAFMVNFSKFTFSDHRDALEINTLYNRVDSSLGKVHEFGILEKGEKFKRFMSLVQELQRTYLKELKINKLIKGHEQKYLADWRGFKQTLSGQILNNVGKGEEFLPDLKNRLESWGNSYSFFAKIKEKIDVSVFNQNEFQSMQELLFLSQLISRIPTSNWNNKRDQLRRESEKIFKTIDRLSIPESARKEIYTSTRAFFVSLQNTLSARESLGAILERKEQTRKILESMLGDFVMPAWHRFTVEKEQVQENIYQKKRILSLEIMAGMSVFILVVLLLLFSKTFPYLGLLEDQAIHISRGDFDTRFEKIPKNEFGEVMNAFNHMASRISTFIKELEGKEREKLELLESVQELRKLNEIGELSAKMAHEIKNPLSILNFCLEDALSALLANDSKTCRSELIKSRDALKRLILITSSLGDGKKAKIVETVRVRELLEKLLEVYASKASRQKIKLSFENNASLETVRVAKLELQGAISNLLDNAFEYLIDFPPTNEPEIRLGLSNTTDFLKIAVINQGSEIRQKEKLFHGFYSSKPGINRGLGLVIVKDTVREFGGDVNYRHSQGFNIFEIRLPLFKEITAPSSFC